jgi:23S rRNA (cytidine2498-2'-O)-methyltransferase
VEYVCQSAFALEPRPCDWLFSDVICYPEKLLRLVQNWKKSGKVKNMVCTIKFQGETDRAALGAFLEISGSSAFHLYNNKHEVTWVSLS